MPEKVWLGPLVRLTSGIRGLLFGVVLGVVFDIFRGVYGRLGPCPGELFPYGVGARAPGGGLGGMGEVVVEIQVYILETSCLSMRLRFSSFSDSDALEVSHSPTIWRVGLRRHC